MKVNFRHSKDKIAETIVQDMIEENDKFLVNIRRLSKYVSRMKSSAATGLNIDNQESGEESKSMRKFIVSKLDFIPKIKTDDLNIDLDLDVSSNPNKLQHLNKGRPKPKKNNNRTKIVATAGIYNEMIEKKIEEKRDSAVLKTTNDAKKVFNRTSVNQPKIE